MRQEERKKLELKAAERRRQRKEMSLGRLKGSEETLCLLYRLIAAGLIRPNGTLVRTMRRSVAWKILGPPETVVPEEAAARSVGWAAGDYPKAAEKISRNREAASLLHD